MPKRSSKKKGKKGGGGKKGKGKEAKEGEAREMFALFQRVRIKGLSSRPELNGQEGEVRPHLPRFPPTSPRMMLLCARRPRRDRWAQEPRPLSAPRPAPNCPPPPATADCDAAARRRGGRALRCEARRGAERAAAWAEAGQTRRRVRRGRSRSDQGAAGAPRAQRQGRRGAQMHGLGGRAPPPARDGASWKQEQIVVVTSAGADHKL